MNWFWFAIIALFCWSGSDLFSKIGCRDSSDKSSHLKMVTAVGAVMGAHALFEIFVQGVEISFDVILQYLPVSLLYILSMALGYIGLRYIELSVSSPICNSSGALVAIASLIFFGTEGMDSIWQYVAIALVCVGVIGIGVVEATEDEGLRLERQKKSNFKYAKSWQAFCLPIAYCVLDAAGTFADGIVLENMNEDSANVAYELTFTFVGLVCFIYTLVRFLQKKETYTVKAEGPKYIGAIFETAGQLAYVYALSDTEHIPMSAPIISSYCVVSVLWSRLFLKEKLSWKHYVAIAVTVAGIIVMGVFDM